MRTVVKRMMLLLTKTKLKTYKEAIIALEEVSRFLECKGHGDEALSIGSTIDKIVNLKHACAKQATLHDYFTQQR